MAIIQDNRALLRDWKPSVTRVATTTPTPSPASRADAVAGTVPVGPENASRDLGNLFDTEQSGLTPLPDGGQEKRITREVPGGTETVTEVWSAEGHYVKTTVTRANGRYRSEITRCHPDGSLKSTEVTERSADGNEFRYKKEVEGDRITETTLEQSVDHDDNPVTREETKVNGELRRRRTTTQLQKPDTDLPGLAWIGAHSPQDLLSQLGDESQVSAVKVVEETLGPDGSRQVHTSLTITSGDGSRELVEHKNGEDGPSTWELRKRNPDGTWNSQLFFQGTEDTVVTRSRKEGKWEVQTQSARTPEMAEASGHQVPSGAYSETFTCENATAEEVRERLQDRELASVCQSDCWSNFAAQHPGPYQTFINMDMATTAGKRVSNGTLIMKAPDGTVLSAVYDGARDLVTACVNPPGDAEPSHLSFIADDERLEVGPDGVQEFVEGRRRVLDRAGSTAAVSKDILTGLGDKVGAKWLNRIGIGTGSGVIALVAVQLAQALADGDMGTATAKAGELGLNLAIVIRSLEDAGVRAASGGNWAGKAGKVLGAVGIIIGLVGAGQQAAEGNVGRAGIAAAGVIGGAINLLWGGGPLGWGLIGLSILGGAIYEHNDRTRVARREI